jgi:hypothetical protein
MNRQSNWVPIGLLIGGAAVVLAALIVAFVAVGLVGRPHDVWSSDGVLIEVTGDVTTFTAGKAITALAAIVLGTFGVVCVRRGWQDVRDRR